MQEMSQERYIEIPEPVREMYKLWRPTPLFARAVLRRRWIRRPIFITSMRGLVLSVRTSRIRPLPRHSTTKKRDQSDNNRNRRRAMGIGAGNGCNFFDIDLEVYMVKVSYHQKPYRRIVMQSFGAQVFASPTTGHNYGRSVLATDPETRLFGHGHL